MEFPFSSDPSRGSSSSDHGYFAAQALRAGMFGYRGDFPPVEMLPPLFGMNMIEREMMKERIREEIIAREMTERRILEEEVRRELEFERAMSARQYTENVLSERTSEIGVQKVEVEFGRRTPTIFDLPARRKDAESLPIAQVNPSKLTGIKKKSACGGVYPQPTAWGCALCQVSCTSKEALEEHLNGKKHKSKASQLAGSKVSVVVDKPSPSTTKDDDVPKGKSIDLTNSKIIKQPSIDITSHPNSKFIGQPNNKTNTQPNSKKTVQSDSKNTGKNNSKTTGQPSSKTTQHVKRKIRTESTAFKNKIFKKHKSIWRCELCKLECNSAIMLNEHLKGKKHSAMLEAFEKKNKEVKTETTVNATGYVIYKELDEAKEDGKKEVNATAQQITEEIKTLTTTNANTVKVIDKKLVEVKQVEKKEVGNTEEMRKYNDQDEESNNKEVIKNVYEAEKEDENKEANKNDEILKDDAEEVPKEEAEAVAVQDDGNPDAEDNNKEERMWDDEKVLNKKAEAVVAVQDDRMTEEVKDVETHS